MITHASDGTQHVAKMITCNSADGFKGLKWETLTSFLFTQAPVFVLG